MTGAEAIAAILRAQRVRTVFALAGASHSWLLDALDRDGCRIVSSRHESGAVGAADGYARALADRRPERPGIALIVSEQGIANAVGGLAVAYALGSPVVVLAAIPPAGFVEPNNLIAAAQMEIVAPVSKWAAAVPSAEHLPAYIRKAIERALSDRPGPVVLFVPQDHFRAELPTEPRAPIARVPPGADPAALGKAAALLAASRRPIAIAGIGAFRGQAAGPLTRLASLGVPVLGNGSGRGLVPEDGKRGWPWPYAQRMADQADCVLVVGEVLTQRLGFGLPPRFASDTTFIQIDVCATAFDRNRPTDAALHGEPGPTLSALLDRLDATEWDTRWVVDGLTGKDALMARLAGSATGTIHPLALARAVARRLGGSTLLVGDGADIANWMYGFTRVTRPGGFIDHFPLGAMGSGTALAVGAAAALAEAAERDGEPPAATILITGDGAIGFHPAELHAAALAGLDLKVVVGNDGAWGTELHGQRETLGRPINTELGQLPYAALAQAFGCTGAQIDDPAGLEPALAALFAESGPALLDARIDPSAGAELKTNPLASSILFNDLAEGRSALAQSLSEEPT